MRPTALLILSLFCVWSRAAQAGVDVVDEPERKPVKAKPVEQIRPADEVDELAPVEEIPAQLPPKVVTPAPGSVRDAGGAAAASKAIPIEKPADAPGVAAPAQPPPPAPAPTPAPSARAPPPRVFGPIDPPRGRYADLLAHFRSRQVALVEQNRHQAEMDTEALQALHAELGFPDLFTTSLALCREAEREFTGKFIPQALATASLATELAPDLPNAWWLLARAQLASEGISGLRNVIRSVTAAVRAEIQEPRYLRALIGNLASAAIAAALAAGALSLALFLGYRLRYALHDFHHFFPSAASRTQTYLLALILLSIPWLFRLGVFAILATIALASWLYLRGRERLIAALALACIVAAPWLLGFAARTASFSQLELDLYWTDRDLDSDPSAQRLAQLAEDPKASYGVLFALASRSKRLGEWADAEKLYRRALTTAPDRAEAENNLANVLLLRGDLAAAKPLYSKALEHNPSLAAAYFNLGQVFNTLLQLDQSQEAQRHALEIDRTLVQRYVKQGERRANFVLIDAPFPWSEATGWGDAMVEEGVRHQAEVRLFGPLAPVAPFAAGAVALLLLILSIAGPHIQPSSPCEKCGRPVCTRCDRALQAEQMCGQCVNVFLKRSIADPLARVRKEAQVANYQNLHRMLTRGLGVLLGGAGLLPTGFPVRGSLTLWALAFLLLTATGAGRWLHAPASDLWVLLALPSVVALAAIYGFGLRRTFVETQ
jgi:tetratricopeptide (TPR) repeat protein